VGLRGRGPFEFCNTTVVRGDRASSPKSFTYISLKLTIILGSSLSVLGVFPSILLFCPVSQVPNKFSPCHLATCSHDQLTAYAHLTVWRTKRSYLKFKKLMGWWKIGLSEDIVETSLAYAKAK